MGRYYHGDIEGKFWFAMMNSNVASVFGDYGEDMFYCEERECEVRASKIEELSEEEKESLCGDPTYIYYSYYYHINKGVEDTNFEIEVLQNRIKETQKLVSKYADFMETKLEEIRRKEEANHSCYSAVSEVLQPKEYVQKLEILSKLIGARRLREATADRYEKMLFYLANFLAFKNDIKDIQPITEVVMGGRIFSKLLESGECVFEGEM
ncbi:hypothetical protein CQA58_04660 [Helicobacter brantae]|uniref:Uncharacterized protein n=2 Tax=Helicobacter brantae TaxID=375927 RepID=A0A3D8IZW8_9HELI|nr:hypothetical protein CQA58_04660 [Helicobacter brantae]